jgi:hypothetical protein
MVRQKEPTECLRGARAHRLRRAGGGDRIEAHRRRSIPGDGARAGEQLRRLRTRRHPQPRSLPGGRLPRFARARVGQRIRRGDRRCRQLLLRPHRRTTTDSPSRRLAAAGPEIDQALADTGVAVIALAQHPPLQCTVARARVLRPRRPGRHGDDRQRQTRRRPRRRERGRSSARTPSPSRPPWPGADPVVFDFSTSSMSHGDLQLLRAEGRRGSDRHRRRLDRRRHHGPGGHPRRRRHPPLRRAQGCDAVIHDRDAGGRTDRRGLHLRDRRRGARGGPHLPHGPALHRHRPRERRERSLSWPASRDSSTCSGTPEWTDCPAIVAMPIAPRLPRPESLSPTPFARCSTETGPAGARLKRARTLPGWAETEALSGRADPNPVRPSRHARCANPKILSVVGQCSCVRGARAPVLETHREPDSRGARSASSCVESGVFRESQAPIPIICSARVVTG